MVQHQFVHASERPAVGHRGRNDVVTPGRNNWNLALYKAFQFNDRARFEFRAESFNTFNHTQLNGLAPVSPTPTSAS